LEAVIESQDLLPLREPTFFIMLSLAHTQKHGYAILKDVESLSDGKVRLSNGTLYGALTRLQDQDLIVRVSNDEPEDGHLSDDHHSNDRRPRKDYRLTEAGLRVLNAEIGRLQNLVATARLHLAEEQA